MLVVLLNYAIPHVHAVKGYEGVVKVCFKRVVLLVLAMTIHNIPEGMAIGASILYRLPDGLLMAIAIGIQDVPEGVRCSSSYIHGDKQ